MINILKQMQSFDIKNMASSQGNAIPNQFTISGEIFDDVENTMIPFCMFQSYASKIALKYRGKIYLDINKWDYSTTTSKYRTLFLGYNTKEVKDMIKNGEIELVELN